MTGQQHQVKTEPAGQAAPSLFNQHPKLFLALGAVLAGLGLVAMVAALASTLATVMLFGGLLLVGGIVHVVDAFSSRHLGGLAPRGMIGLLYILVGGLMLYDPLGAAISLTLLIAIFFLIAGLSRLVLAAQFPTQGRGWLTAGGVLDLLLGTLIGIGWPESSVWVIGLFVGIELLLGGLAMLLFATAARRYLSLLD